MGGMAADPVYVEATLGGDIYFFLRCVPQMKISSHTFTPLLSQTHQIFSLPKLIQILCDEKIS